MPAIAKYLKMKFVAIPLIALIIILGVLALSNSPSSSNAAESSNNVSEEPANNLIDLSKFYSTITDEVATDEEAKEWIKSIRSKDLASEDVKKFDSEYYRENQESLKNHGNTYAEIAINNENFKICNWLKKNGVDFFQQDYSGTITLAYNAIKSDLPNAILWLAKNGLDLNSHRSGNAKTTIVHNASGFGSIKILKWLKDCGVNMAIKDEKLGYPIYAAQISGKDNRKEVIQWLRDNGGIPIRYIANGENTEKSGKRMDGGVINVDGFYADISPSVFATEILLNNTINNVEPYIDDTKIKVYFDNDPEKWPVEKFISNSSPFGFIAAGYKLMLTFFDHNRNYLFNASTEEYFAPEWTVPLFDYRQSISNTGNARYSGVPHCLREKQNLLSLNHTMTQNALDNIGFIRIGFYVPGRTYDYFLKDNAVFGKAEYLKKLTKEE